jgi:hypothetical protein
MKFRKLRNPGRAGVDAQEDTCDVLWRFAERLGAPIKAENGHMIRERGDAVRAAIEEIANAYGYNVMEIQ